MYFFRMSKFIRESKISERFGRIFLTYRGIVTVNQYVARVYLFGLRIPICKWFITHVPVVPARGGAEVALKIYIRPFSSIELARAVRQPSPCVRALCESGVLFHMSRLKLHFSLHSSHSTLHTSHFTLHTSHFTLHSSQSTLHTSLRASHCTLHTSHFTLHTSHFTLHTSHCTLHAPHFTLHSSHSTLHLIWALLTLSQLISSHLISSHMSPKLSWITSQYYYYY